MSKQRLQCRVNSCILGPMTQRTVVTLEDDLTGEEAAETVSFALDGRAYEIDLTEANASALREALAPYVGCRSACRSGECACRAARRAFAPRRHRSRSGSGACVGSVKWLRGESARANQSRRAGGLQSSHGLRGGIPQRRDRLICRNQGFSRGGVVNRSDLSKCCAQRPVRHAAASKCIAGARDTHSVAPPGHPGAGSGEIAS